LAGDAVADSGIFFSVTLRKDHRMEHRNNGFDVAVLNEIRDLLIGREESIAVAESVTAGHLQVAFSLAENAMEFFQGGLTAYNVGQKARHLHVDPIHAIACDSVSEKVAAQMAQQVAVLFGADWGIAITGYATPVPEKNIHELFACFAISFQGRCVFNCTVTAGNGKQEHIRYFYTNEVLKHLLNEIKAR
jgi:nicotinamide-nucleotide amidase